MIQSASDRTAMRFKSREDELDYRLIYAISFVMFFTLAVGSRVTDWSRFSQSPETSQKKSVLQQAKSNASSAVAFAFMQ